MRPRKPSNTYRGSASAWRRARTDGDVTLRCVRYLQARGRGRGKRGRAVRRGEGGRLIIRWGLPDVVSTIVCGALGARGRVSS
jgi:hypothetical protein